MHVPPFSFIPMDGHRTIYTLTRDELQAIAARAAELAIEQAIEGTVPIVRRPHYTIDDDRDPDTPELTQYERATVAALFKQ